MRRIMGKRRSTGETEASNSKKKKEEHTGICNLTAECYTHLVRFLEDEDIDHLGATNKLMRDRMDTESIWHIRYNNCMLDSYDSPRPGKLHTADTWKSLVYWQRSEITYSDNSLFGKNQNVFKLDPNMVGVRKVVITDCCIFVLDNAGKVHKWDEDDHWKLNVLEQVVDIITDASDLGRHRTSLFVLSQSDTLFKDRPKLRDFIQYKKDGIRSRDFERKLRHWHPNGAPRSGDRVDVFRVESSSLRRVFKMTFQQAHRFTSLQVSNRDYLKSASSPYVSDSRGKHINELQLLTTKGRVWSLTVNEPELIANGGGAQVALKNISSRFDMKEDDDEQLLVEKTFNGKFLSGLLCRSGNLHLFSDKPNKMKEMFPQRTFVQTSIGNDQDTQRPSTTINVGARIFDVSISNTHILIIDIYGRLWAVGGNRVGQLGLNHLIDQSNPKLVPLNPDVKRTISVAASSNSSTILCELKDGSIQAYFAGKLNGGTLIGYSLTEDTEDYEDDFSYHYSRSKIIDQFKQIDISLTRKTDSVKMTNNQIVFLARHSVDKKLPFKELPTDLESMASLACRSCENADPSWCDHYGNEFSNAVTDKNIRWLNERITCCACPMGNHVYRTILTERLTIARQMQRLHHEDTEDFGNWMDKLDPEIDNRIDELIEALALAHSINNQLPPFSALH